MSTSTERFAAEKCLGLLRREILPLIREHCACTAAGVPWLKVCGSLRRGLPAAGDIDIVFISSRGSAVPPGELLPQPNQWLVHAAIHAAVQAGVLAWKRKKDGSQAAGEDVMQTVHVGTGIPVDFYRATFDSWWNVILCRTGSMEHNRRMAQRAIEVGWKWRPSARHPGFENPAGRLIKIESEEHFYRFLGLKHFSPHERT